MSLPQHLLFQVGGSVSIDLENVPTSAAVRIIQGDGTQLVGTLAATLTTINTVINSAATRGARSLNVVAVTGMANGVKMRLQDDPEEVRIRAVAGNLVHLRAPLMYDHANGASVQGTRAVRAINATQASSLFFDGHCEWNIDGSVSDYTAVECTRYPMRRHATVDDVLSVESAWFELKDPALDIEAWLDLAHMRVLRDIGAASNEMRTRVFPASDSFRHATALAALVLFYMRQPGAEQQELYRTFKAELRDELGKLVGQLPRDANQDGVASANERQSMGSVRLIG